MNKEILIVEDEFIVADDLQLMLESSGYTVCGIAASVNEARELIKEKRPGLVLLDIHLKGKLSGIELGKELRDEGIAFVYLSANSNQKIFETAKATEPYGFLVKPYRTNDLLNILEIAFYRDEHSRDSGWRRENFLRNELTVIPEKSNGAIERFLKMARVLQRYIPFDFIAGKSQMKNNRTGFIALHRTGFDEYQVIGYKELSVVGAFNLHELQSVFNAEATETKAGFYNGKDFENYLLWGSSNAILAKSFRLKSSLVLPLLSEQGNIFSLHLYRQSENGYDKELLNSLSGMQQPLTGIVSRIQPEEMLPSENERRSGTLMELKNDDRFDNIVGNSTTLLSVLGLVDQVAPLDTSVLILGESGTGKEKMADLIHQLSPRSNNPLIKINCASLPPTLIETELFGHEKGSFTGATERKTGKFELADKGTIFLDEIGEMPLNMQTKLLRVLQEKEIERIGGKHPLKVDVRIIAATNRNLEKEMAEGRFRLDLYFRLNVFPITLPPLRERRGDILILSKAFAEKFGKKINKKFGGISDQMAAELEEYHWPGNIRELENIIEQSVIVTPEGSKLHLRQSLLSNRRSITDVDEIVQMGKDFSLEDNEREHILKILRKTNGRIRGEGGAAELLKIPPTTLHSKMKKLGISRSHQ